eukprot:CAMPEP_0205823982 /NCGR_PEP_ID=MMETSP0206-20130828/18880_1 /ASSEMBLY_ACC=CAM_ASM_000279 /TAXON_ID=36767 /ORGANISM="Euplotes focardii, Strain TN1" /LENGTH=100 /DNA_ID=CAMNT_0053121671 /DNA_START=268 /DNA_END=567 /DNA_ORIENTATION=-
MSIAEDPLYPWALHRLALNHEREGNYKLALDSAYESQDLRLFEKDKEAQKAFNKTIERLEGLIEIHGPINDELKPKEEDSMQEFFDNAFANLKKIAADFP